MSPNVLWVTDRPELPTSQHNYVKAQYWLMENGKLHFERRSTINISFEHDDWCNIYDGHLCNCRPNVLVNGKRMKYPAKVLGDTYAGNHR